MKRKGLGKGLGMGYKNLALMDSHIHSLSARGMKQKTMLFAHTKNVPFKEKERLIELTKDIDLPPKTVKNVEDEVDSTVEKIETWSDEDDFFLLTMKDETTWVVAPSDERAEEVATEQVKEDLENEPEIFNQDWLIGQMNLEEVEEYFKEVYDEWNRGYVDDIESEEDDEFPNRLRQEMVGRDLITEEEAKDEEFDVEDKKDEFVEQMTTAQIDEGSGGYDYYVSNFGKEEANKIIIDNNLIDIDEASEDAVSTDGWQHFLSRYDGNSTELDDERVIWREN